LQPAPAPTAPPAERVCFCGHCGERRDTGATCGPRVCEKCQLGLMLEAAPQLAPAPGGAFVVLDRSLSVCAVSRAAERLLDVYEPSVVNCHVSELFEMAEPERQGRVPLAEAIFRAARGDREVIDVTVRPARTFGVRLRARVGLCGPHPAALLVFD
jgi:hypothetical protein